MDCNNFDSRSLAESPYSPNAHQYQENTESGRLHPGFWRRVSQRFIKCIASGTESRQQNTGTAGSLVQRAETVTPSSVPRSLLVNQSELVGLFTALGVAERTAKRIDTLILKYADGKEEDHKNEVVQQISNHGGDQAMIDILAESYLIELQKTYDPDFVDDTRKLEMEQRAAVLKEKFKSYDELPYRPDPELISSHNNEFECCISSVQCVEPVCYGGRIYEYDSFKKCLLISAQKDPYTQEAVNMEKIFRVIPRPV